MENSSKQCKGKRRASDEQTPPTESQLVETSANKEEEQATTEPDALAPPVTGESASAGKTVDEPVVDDKEAPVTAEGEPIVAVTEHSEEAGSKSLKLCKGKRKACDDPHSPPMESSPKRRKQEHAEEPVVDNDEAPLIEEGEPIVAVTGHGDESPKTENEAAQPEMMAAETPVVSGTSADSPVEVTPTGGDQDISQRTPELRVAVRRSSRIRDNNKSGGNSGSGDDSSGSSNYTTCSSNGSETEAKTPRKRGSSKRSSSSSSPALLSNTGSSRRSEEASTPPPKRRRKQTEAPKTPPLPIRRSERKRKGNDHDGNGLHETPSSAPKRSRKSNEDETHQERDEQEKQEEVHLEETEVAHPENDPATTQPEAPPAARPRLLPPPVRGSFHQGDPDHCENVGVQCVPTSLMAILRSTDKNVTTWTTDDLDEVVRLGDQLYGRITKGRDDSESSLLFIQDLPKKIGSKTMEYAEVYPAWYGDISEDCPIISLREVLDIVFALYSACFLNVDKNVCAIIREGDLYAVVDSHPRSEDWRFSPDGTSVAVYFSDLDELSVHIWGFAEDLTESESGFVELTGVSVTESASPPPAKASNKKSPKAKKRKSAEDTTSDLSSVADNETLPEQRPKKRTKSVPPPPENNKKPLKAKKRKSAKDTTSDQSSVAADETLPEQRPKKRRNGKS